MKTLGIDTTALVASVAITENGKLLASFDLDSGNTHSTTLLPMIESAMKALRLTVDDIDLISVAAGPGSFTGLRIGAATAKGLALKNNTPCVGVSSLAAMAENLRGLKGIACPVINARRERVYTALFELDAERDPKRITEDGVLPIADLAERLEGFRDRKIYLTGDASNEVGERAGIPFETLPLLLGKQNAAGVALLGETSFRRATGAEREGMTHASLGVIYLRKTQAEREREERISAEKNNGGN